MAHPQDDGQFILDTDASGTMIGCVLSQVQDGKEKVIAYESQTLSRTERNYCVTDRELLAVCYFMEYYKQYLLGQKFLVQTDHQALKWLFSLKEPKDQNCQMVRDHVYIPVRSRVLTWEKAWQCGCYVKTTM